MIPEIVVLFFAGKAVPGKTVEQLPGGKVEDGEGAFQKLLCNTVCQKCLAGAGASVQKQVRMCLREILNEPVGFRQCGLGQTAGRQSCAGIDHIFGIIVFPEMGKIFPFQYLPQIGLVVQKIDLCLSETVTFLAAGITGILTIRADIVRFQIICRKTVFGQKVIPFLTKCMDLCGALRGLPVLVTQHEAGAAGLERGDLCLQIRKSGNGIVYGLLAFFLPEAVVRLPSAVDAHDRVILFIR